MITKERESLSFASSPKLVKLPCKISRSGFPRERVFEIRLAGGDIAVKGAAPLVYFFDSDGLRLGDDVPPPGALIDGFVAAKIFDERDSERVAVSLPSGDVIVVPVEMTRDD